MEIFHQIESAQWLIESDAAILISGWCAAANRTEIRTVEAYAGARQIATTSMQERPDVQNHFAGNHHARWSGFTLNLPLLELETVIELRARSGTEAPIPFFSVRAGDLPYRGVITENYLGWRTAQQSEKEVVFDPARFSKILADPSAPLISLLLPVYNTSVNFLHQCVESVVQQVYPRWELQIVDDGSTNSELGPCLARLAAQDIRIQVTSLPCNSGIAHATNCALARARAEYVGFIDHDDRLHPQALVEVAKRLVETNADAVYTDEEKITAKGESAIGFFKPDFSPEFLRGVMYVGHFLCVRTALARTIGGFDSTFDGIQDFEFVLRLSERTTAIEHIPRILYQWRMSPSSSALSGNVKGDMDKLQVQAVERHLARLQQNALVMSLGNHRVRLQPMPRDRTSKSILVVKNQSVLETLSGLEDHDVLILSTPSVQELRRVLARCECDRFVWINEPLASASSNFIEVLLAVLDESTVGAAAPVLLASDGKILASGVVVSPNGKLVPAMRGFWVGGEGYNGSLLCSREVSSVLTSCVALRKSAFLDALGDADHPFSDAGMAGLCRTLLRLHFRIVNCASVHVTTRRHWADCAEVGEIEASHHSDPYYNPHFDAAKGDYRLLPPR